MSPPEDLGGNYNLNLRTQTGRGDLVIRVYRPWVTSERLDAIQRLRRWVAARDITTPLSLAQPDGATRLVIDGRQLEVEPWQVIAPDVESWARYRSAFALLGQLHAALRDLPDAAGFPVSVAGNMIRPKRFRRWIRQTRAALIHAPVSERTTAALEVCAYAQGLHEVIIAMQPHVPVGHLTHGDFKTDNIIYRDDDAIGVLDFDFVDWRDRLRDLAYTAYWMFRALEFDRAPAAWSWGIMPELIARYDAASGLPLTPAEIHALPLMMAQVPLYWVAEGWLLDDPVQAALAMSEDVAISDWLVSHWLVLAERWTTS